jgi:hypothetical protein
VSPPSVSHSHVSSVSTRRYRVLVLASHVVQTYDHMLWEYEAAYPALRSGGLLLSDDALWNDAFRDFGSKVHEPDSRILRGVGFLCKSAE